MLTLLMVSSVSLSTHTCVCTRARVCVCAAVPAMSATLTGNVDIEEDVLSTELQGEMKESG